MRSSLYPEIQFDLRVDVLEQGDGIVRVRVDEVGSKTPFRRYNETAKWVLLDESPRLSSSAKLSSTSDRSTISYGAGLSLEIQHSPFRITQLRDGRPEIVLNDRSLFHMEHFRIKEQESAEELLGEGAQTVLKGGELDRSWFEETDADMFEEQWKKWRDSKPKGASCE
jgi:alpha 1,3-glucosidase